MVAESIRKGFGRKTAVVSASLEVHSGRVTFLAGRNGSGKTTLLQILAGRLSPDGGSVRFAGRAFSAPRLADLARRGLFFLPDRRILSPSLTLAEHLRVVELRTGGRSTLPVIDFLGVAHLLDRRPAGFSEGEGRRAELALALVRNPSCLIADEPLRGLDPKDMQLLLEVFRAMATNGSAVVVSGHQPEDMMTVADEVIWMREGRSHVLGPPEEAQLDAQFRREYLEGGQEPL